MSHDPFTLEEQALEVAQAAFDAEGDHFIREEIDRQNLVGLGVGVKHVAGQPTGEPALVALVTQKLPKSLLTESDIVPSSLGGVATDVIEVGYLFAGYDSAPPDGGAAPTDVIDAQRLTGRRRPAQGGYSIGHVRVSAGTLGTGVIDRGIGVPSRYYALSNNHVLADNNAARIGDPILQPGAAGGGVYPRDVIGRLARFVPIQFEPGTPLARQKNLVDAALAEVPFHDLDRAVYWKGYADGWVPATAIRPGMIIKKTGRTTNYSSGRVLAVKATVNVNYGGGRVARFTNQFVTTAMSSGGDSGSLGWLGQQAAGLLFAGSSRVTIFNYFEHVRRLLGIELS